jgi:hypothetical protein
MTHRYLTLTVNAGVATVTLTQPESATPSATR